MRTLVTAAVRAPPILATVALLFGAPGCGRFGYLPMPVDVDADAGPSGDARPGRDGVDPDGAGSPEIGPAGDGPMVTSDADASPPLRRFCRLAQIRQGSLGDDVRARRATSHPMVRER